MPKKPKLPPKFAPLQIVVAQPITDPTVQASMLKAHKRHRRKLQRNAKQTDEPYSW